MTKYIRDGESVNVKDLAPEVTEVVVYHGGLLYGEWDLDLLGITVHEGGTVRRDKTPSA